MEVNFKHERESKQHTKIKKHFPAIQNIVTIKVCQILYSPEKTFYYFYRWTSDLNYISNNRNLTDEIQGNKFIQADIKTLAPFHISNSFCVSWYKILYALIVQPNWVHEEMAQT